MTSTFKPVRELRGLALPVRQDPRGPFNSKTETDVAWGDLLRAVLVPRGSQPMRRNFGSSLHELLAEPMDVEDEFVIALISDSVRNSCPHIILKNVSVRVVRTQLEIGVTFSLVSNPEEPVTRTTTIKRTNVSARGIY